MFEHEKLIQLLKTIFGDATTREIAKKTGLSHGYVWTLLSGSKHPTTGRPVQPSPKMLKKIALAYSYPYEEILRVANIIDHEMMLDADQSPASKTVPLLSSIRSGQPIFAPENVDAMVPVVVPDDATYYYLRQHDASMENACIPCGSRVLVRQQNFVDSHQYAVVMVAGQDAMIRKVQSYEGNIILVPAHPLFNPTVHPQDDVTIVGKVIRAEIDF